MKTKIYALMALLFLLNSAIAQDHPILIFTAVNNQDYLQLDSIKIINRTQGGDTMLIWPDTMLSPPQGFLDHKLNNEVFYIEQNYPNPVTDKTTIEMSIPAENHVRIVISDILGRIVHESNDILKKGKHTYIFTPGKANVYFFSSHFRNYRRSIKIINRSDCNANACELHYKGYECHNPQLKADDGIMDFIFVLGDTLVFAGYSGGLESGGIDVPVIDTVYTIQFASNIPCPGTPTVMYGGQEYNTIQIFNQCWLKENLNIGLMIDQSQSQSNNGIIEKYCFSNDEDSCAKYGGLYRWNEMMEYINLAGAQGICPDGWHVPTDEEWMILEGAVDDQYGIGSSVWDNIGHRGFDVGANLKTTNGWYNNGNGYDLYGFSLKPSGYHLYSVLMVTKFTYLWTSTRKSSLEEPFHRDVNFSNPTIFRGSNYGSGCGMSVRCVKD